MNFFKPEDFDGLMFGEPSTLFERICGYANAKLEREGKVVYCEFPRDSESTLDLIRFNEATHKALLINIEPIEKCKHPENKIKVFTINGYDPTISLKDPTYKNEYYQCECGAKVKPTAFEEVK